MISIAESTYYADPKISRAEQEEWDADIRGKIEQIRVEHETSGYRMLLHHLKRSGVEIGERRLRRVMSKFQLHIKSKKRFVHTTDSKHGHRVYPNLIKGKEIDGINQVWASDFTYIRIENGFVYLAVWICIREKSLAGEFRNVSTHNLPSRL